jgi:hypothetical protein
MHPDRMDFLIEFDRFYQELVNDIKEARYTEQDFYLIIIAEAKAMNRERLDQKRI